MCWQYEKGISASIALIEGIRLESSVDMGTRSHRSRDNGKKSQSPALLCDGVCIGCVMKDVFITCIINAGHLANWIIYKRDLGRVYI